MIEDTKFDDCQDCALFRKRNGQQVIRGDCRECTSGEFFEPNDNEPSVDDFFNGKR